MNFKTDKQIEEEAGEFRRAFGVYDQQRPDIKRFLFKAKEIGLIADYSRQIDSRLNARAAYDGDKKILYLADEIFCDLDRHSSYANFSVVHELSHAWRGDKGINRRSTTPGAELRKNKSVETSANRLTGAILMPFHLTDYRTGMMPADLVKIFGVSLKSAQIRMPVIERLYRQANGILRPLPPEVTKFLSSK